MTWMSAYWLFLSLVAIAYAAWLSFRVYRAFLRLPRKSTLDIDGDGLANEIDPMPRHCDGDFFGVAKPLPAGANANAYYWLDLSVTGSLGVAKISVTCDGESNLGNHVIIARTNQLCHIPLMS